MLLVIDAGNTNVAIGVYREEELLFVSRLATDPTMTEDQFAIALSNIFKLNGIEGATFKGAAISSVVPELTRAIKRGARKVTESEPVVLGPGVKTGLDIRIDNPTELGADLAATAVGALGKYELPCIIVDLGTATKVTVLGEDGAFLGCAIAPGMLISLNALAKGASQLSSIALKSPRATIGTNTVESMRAGLVHGTAEMLDGLIDRMNRELSTEAKTIVATGGLCTVVAKHCRHEMVIDQNLLLEGLRKVYEKNN